MKDCRLLLTVRGRPQRNIRQAIEQHLEDLKDIYLAEQALGRLERGETGTRSLKEVLDELGLDD